MSTFYWLAGLVAAVSATVLWYALVRPVPSTTSNGVITAKEAVEARTIERRRAGPRREDWNTDKIPVPSGTRLAIQVDGLSEPVRFFLADLRGKDFEVGQRVTVTYQLRSLPLLWSRVMVQSVERLQP